MSNKYLYVLFTIELLYLNFWTNSIVFIIYLLKDYGTFTLLVQDTEGWCWFCCYGLLRPQIYYTILSFTVKRFMS